MTRLKWRDLGLAWDQAAHGVQTATAFEHERGGDSGSPKHLRTGLNMAMSDHAALAFLLIEKGIITEAEYLEAIRLAANDELARHEDLHKGITFR